MEAGSSAGVGLDLGPCLVGGSMTCFLSPRVEWITLDRSLFDLSKVVCFVWPHSISPMGEAVVP